MHIYAKLHMYARMNSARQDIPFVVGKPVTGKYFIDRKEELKKITALLSGNAINNIALLAQRRTGKSSVLYNLKEKDTGKIHVLFDAYGISTKERFAKAYINSVRHCYTENTGDKAYNKRIRESLVEGANVLTSKISDVGISVFEFVKFQVTVNKKEADPDELLENALNYAETLAKEKGVLLVIMIDEFQELLKWGDGFLRTFRKIMQSQQKVCYVLSGSAPTTMRRLVYDSKSPLYRQLMDIRLDRLPKRDVIAFVKRRLAAANMGADSGAAEYIFELSRGYADYVQRIGMHVFWMCLGSNKRLVTRHDVDDAYEDMLVRLDADFGAGFSRHTDLEKEILFALAAGKASISAMALEIRTSQSTIPKTLNRLIASDIVERYRHGKYRITDGVFSDWIYKQTHARVTRSFRSSYTTESDHNPQ